MLKSKLYFIYLKNPDILIMCFKVVARFLALFSQDPLQAPEMYDITHNLNVKITGIVRLEIIHY